MITVFTPTYNRAYILPQLYNSLCRQTCEDFIWLVVDDGSTDNTQELISEWQALGKIDIRYFSQKNGGKMRAHNVGVQKCNTELFVCVDSDDYLIDDAIEKIIEKWNSITEKQSIAGIIGYRQIMKDGQCDIPRRFPIDGPSTLHGLYDMGFIGDTTLIFKTDVIRSFLFPELDGEKFITEAFVYDKIDKLYKYHLIEEGLTICKYRDDGYTNNTSKLKKDNPGGWALYYNQLPSYWPKGVIWNYKMRAYSLAFLFLSGKFSLMKSFKRKYTTLLSLPLGLRYWYLMNRHFNNSK